MKSFITKSSITISNIENGYSLVTLANCENDVAIQLQYGAGVTEENLKKDKISFKNDAEKKYNEDDNNTDEIEEYLYRCSNKELQNIIFNLMERVDKSEGTCEIYKDVLNMNEY